MIHEVKNNNDNVQRISAAFILSSKSLFCAELESLKRCSAAEMSQCQVPGVSQQT